MLAPKSGFTLQSIPNNNEDYTSLDSPKLNSFIDSQELILMTQRAYEDDIRKLKEIERSKNEINNRLILHQKMLVSLQSGSSGDSERRSIG